MRRENVSLSGRSERRKSMKSMKPNKHKPQTTLNGQNKPLMCFSFAGRSTWFVALTIAISNSYELNTPWKRSDASTIELTIKKSTFFIFFKYLVITIDFSQWNCGGILKGSKRLPEALLRTSAWHSLYPSITKFYKCPSITNVTHFPHLPLLTSP